MNIEVHLSFCISAFFFSRYILRSRIAGSHGSSIINLDGTSILFSIAAAPIYIPTHNVQDSLFFTSSPTFVICRLFDDSYSDRWGDISLSFWPIFLLIIHNVEHFFMCLLTICMYSFGKCQLRSSEHISIELFVLFFDRNHKSCVCVYCFLGPHPHCMEIPRLGLNWSHSCWPIPQPQQHGIWAKSVIYTTAHGNSESPTH